MPKRDRIRILIADPQPLMRQGLRTLIESQQDMRVIAEANNGREALELFFLHRPDVTLIDLRLSEISGVDAIRAIRNRVPTARIIVLSSYAGGEDIYRAIHAGAKSYLLKDASQDVLLDSVRAVHRGETKIPPRVASKLAARLSSPELTAREFEVVRLVVAGKSNKEIGASLQVSEATVKAHVNHIFRKLNARGRTEAATLALKRGIIHLPENH